MGYVTGADGSTKQIGIVVERGGQADPRPSQTQSGEFVSRLPGVHGDGVETEHLALVGPEKSIENQCIFPGVPDYGTVIGGSNNTGSNRFHGGNIWAGIQDQSSGMSGNVNLLQMLAFLLSKDSRRMRPPKWNETTKNGAKIRQIQEQGPWLPNLLNGIATHAAYAQIAGSRLPQIKNIPTAVQAYANILTDDQAGNIIGTLMSIGSILAAVLSHPTHGQTIRNSVPPQTLMAIESLSSLSQSGETLLVGGSTSGVRVNPDIFLPHVAELLSQCKTPNEILYALTELSGNSAYFGVDSEDLILNLDKSSGNGDFILGDQVWQYANTVPGVDKLPIGKVIKWDSTNKILDLDARNAFQLNPSANVFSINIMSPAVYNVNTFSFFVTSNANTTVTNTVYGPVSTQIDPYGNVRNSSSNDAALAFAAMSIVMKMASMFMSADPGKAIFDDGEIVQSLDRLTPASQAARTNLHMEVNQENLVLPQRKLALQGGPPLSIIPDSGGAGGALGGLAGGLGGISGLLSGGLGSIAGLTGIPGLRQFVNMATQAAMMAATQSQSSPPTASGVQYIRPSANTSNTTM